MAVLCCRRGWSGAGYVCGVYSKADLAAPLFPPSQRVCTCALSVFGELQTGGKTRLYFWRVEEAKRKHPASQAGSQRAEGRWPRGFIHQRFPSWLSVSPLLQSSCVLALLGGLQLSCVAVILIPLLGLQ